jgi:hypothetical protein
MSKFNVGDILISKQANFSDNKRINVLITKWLGQDDYYTDCYRVLKLNDGSEYTWNANHVDYHYERAT